MQFLCKKRVQTVSSWPVSDSKPCVWSYANYEDELNEEDQNTSTKEVNVSNAIQKITFRLNDVENQLQFYTDRAFNSQSKVGRSTCPTQIVCCMFPLNWRPETIIHEEARRTLKRNCQLLVKSIGPIMHSFIRNWSNCSFHCSLNSIIVRGISYREMYYTKQFEHWFVQ